MATTDANIRKAAFDWLMEQVDLHGDVLPRSVLAQGFTYEGNRVPLLGPQGIFKPRVIDIPLSITSTPSGPYDDGYSPDGLLLYRYRGTDPQHPDNVGLREAMRRKIPLVYFHRVVEGKYLVLKNGYSLKGGGSGFQGPLIGPAHSRPNSPRRSSSPPLRYGAHSP